MTQKVTIAKLVKTSLIRNTPKKVFLSLLLQTIQTGTISDNELLEGLIEIDRRSMSSEASIEQIQLSLEFAGSSEDNAKLFFSLLLRLLVESQVKYLTCLRNTYDSLFKASILQEFVAAILPEYTREVELLVMSAGNLSSHEIRALWCRLMFLWRVVVERNASFINHSMDGELFLMCSKQTQFSLEYTRKTVQLISAQNKNSAHQSTHELDVSFAKAPAPSDTIYSLNCFSKKYASYLKLKKTAWLTARFRTWNFNDLLLEKFFSFFKIPTQNPKDIIQEIINSFFTGLVLAIELNEKPYILFNWKNYIVSRLQNAIKNFRPIEIAGISEDISEQLILTTMLYDMSKISHCKIGGSKAPYDLRKKFLRSCIYSKIITLDQYAKEFNDDARLMSQSLITHEVDQLSHVDHITHAFNTKLANVNVEFTSFEESKLIEYFQSLPDSNFEYLADKQVQISILVENLVTTSTQDKNYEKLSRLLLGILNSLSTANFIFFCSNKGPWLILEMLINYIDKESFSIEEDDCNFQDTYSSFGTILSSVISIVSFFGIDFNGINIKGSYTIDYINKFFFRLGDTLTNLVTDNDDDDKTIIANYETLLADWVSSLFDVNNEGLSDELLKSVNIKQIYKFMLIIFQQAVSARIVNVLSTTSINNGIDYLSQNFLAPCSVEIIKWMTSRIGSNQPHSEAFIEIILQIIESNMGSDQASNLNGPNFTFRMILNITSPHIFNALKGISKNHNPNAMKLLDFLHSTVDAEYSIPHIEKSNVEWESSDSSFPLKNVKAECSSIIKKPPVDTSSLAVSWAKINYYLNGATGQELSDTILDELSKCMKAPLHAQSEELRLIVDYLVFTIIIGSVYSTEDVSNQLRLLDQGESQECTQVVEQVSKFQLTMENHYSAVFNEGASSGSPTLANVLENPEDDVVKDELMGFDTDDLFNDMPQDLFEDLMDIVSASTASNAVPPPTLGSHRHSSILSSYLSVRNMRTPLFDVLLQLGILSESHPYWNRLANIAKTRIRNELTALPKGI